MAFLRRLWPLLVITGCYDLDYGRQNASPIVVIDSPQHAQRVESPLVITGTASDDDDGDLSAEIVWKSDEELIGVGAFISVELPEGQHLISGSVSDSEGAVASAQISITVTTTSTQ